MSRPPRGGRRPPRGGRGLKYSRYTVGVFPVSRPPRGGRGLKYKIRKSLIKSGSRPPRGGRGLKYVDGVGGFGALPGRPPRGGRGLKCLMQTLFHPGRLRSPPSRGAWIEMHGQYAVTVMVLCRPPRGGRGLKSSWKGGAIPRPTSPPSRGAWIEIRYPKM